MVYFLGNALDNLLLRCIHRQLNLPVQLPVQCFCVRSIVQLHDQSIWLFDEFSISFGSTFLFNLLKTQNSQSSSVFGAIIALA
jgi:hypothetical protein